jgi:cell division protein FtsQ
MLRDERPVDGDDAPERERTPRRVWRRRLALVVIAAVVVLLAPLGLRRLDYFRVRRVEIVGARYIPPSALQERLAIDTTKTIWEDLDQFEKRIRGHVQVRDVKVSRKLPGTLVVRIVENRPVALFATPNGLQPIDATGQSLPIDPSRTAVDLPIIARRDTAALRLLDGIRARDASLFARISEIRWDERGGMRVLMSGMTVRAAADCTPDRFAEIIPVELDLTRRGYRAIELDLRYRDQIVARIE